MAKAPARRTKAAKPPARRQRAPVRKPRPKAGQRERTKATAPKSKPEGKARPETVMWTPKKIAVLRRNGDIPASCPVCGSKRLDVRKADGLVKGAAKVAASVAVPLVLRMHPEVDCLSCGWRSEANY